MGPTYVGNGKVNYAAFFPVTDGYRGVFLGGLCALASPLVLPFILLCGYTARLTGAAARNAAVVPPFDDVRQLARDGVFYTVLAALVVGVGAVVVEGLATAGATLDQPGTLVAVGTVVGIAVSYVLPAVLVLYPVTGRLGEALSPDRIAEFAFSPYYAVSYLIFLGLAVVGLVAAAVVVLFVGFLSVIFPFAGLPLAFLTVVVVPPYLFYAAGAYWGGTYQMAVRDGSVPEPVSQADEQPPSGSRADRHDQSLRS